jgi:hypothetical protein
LTLSSYLGHGLCITCIDTLFAGASPFKCPTCRKHIYLEDALQIFLNPHRSPTQHTTQSTPKGSDVAIQSGARLRKAVTKDRSSVAISGIVIGEVSPRPASPPAATSPAQFAHSPVPGAPAMTQGSSNIRRSQG